MLFNLLQTAGLDSTDFSAAAQAAAEAVPHEEEMHLLEMATKGGWLMLVLLALSIIAIYIFGKKWWMIHQASTIDANFMRDIRDYIREGKINVRSKIVPVVNIRSRFGKEEIPFNDRTCIIIVSTGDDVSVGLIVDSVADVIPVTEQHISKTPELTGVNSNKFIKSILEMNDGIKLVLDVSKLIDEHASEEMK